MNSQPDLFAHERLARRGDVHTSRDAAQNVTAFGQSHEGKVFDAIRQAGERGATYREVASATGMEPVAVARRLSGMAERGLIKRREIEPGEKPIYETRGGCAVWRKS